VATHLGSDHTEHIVRPDVEELFGAIAAMFDEPFGDPSAIPTYLVAHLARRSVTVALSGDGGDELFGGYTRYRRSMEIGGRERGGARQLVSALGLMLPHMFPGRNRLVDFGRTRWGRYAATVVQPVRLDEGGVVREDQAGGDVYVDEQLRDRICLELGDDFAAAMMQLDLETYLPGDILTKVDRTSMAVSLEARVPLLDFDLVDFALRIPGQWRVTAAETKRLFRRAITSIVPEEVLSRPKKGFEIPLGRWFRGPLRHRIEALRDPSQELRQYVDIGAVRRLVLEHVIGRRDHSNMLWRLIVLDCWVAALRQGRLGRPPELPQIRVA
jgi:asparagine synthase (glutamine-hydrolysing)